jgi:hypothetical protein
MLRFKQETGKEVSDGLTLSDLITLMWCCIASACARDGAAFSLSVLEMADAMDQGDFEAWQKSLSPDPSPQGKGNEGKKKV